MGLPVVVEIAIGLIFIYLALSLVASEIQEIISALFQWRAEHLKRSIEQLLAGDSLSGRTSGQLQGNRASNRATDRATDRKASRKNARQSAKQNARAAKTLADDLYSSPLIENLNYEAQGRLASGLRAILHGVGTLYRTLTFSRNVFGRKTSGPSYIPAETFATSLIDRLKLADFQRLLVRSRFQDFVENDVQRPLHNMVHELRARLGQEDLLASELAYFDAERQQILDDLSNRRITLEAALERLSLALETFEAMTTDMPLSPDSQASAVASSFAKRVRYLRQGLDGSSQKIEALLVRIRPSLSDLTALLDPNSATYAELVAVAQREGGAVWESLQKLQQAVIPPRLRESMATLGDRAERRVKTRGAELQQLQTEVEEWFNRGMDRASGVYRRNVKGVGLMIGFAIAFMLNADTFYMFNRLSTDQAIRNSIIQTVDQLEVRSLENAEALSRELQIDGLSEELREELQGDLRSVGTAVENALAAYPLPIGRSPEIFRAQQRAEANWPIPYLPQRLFGWAVTGLALSMGASFWFDLLRKVTSARASGDRPSKA